MKPLERRMWDTSRSVFALMKQLVVEKSTEEGLRKAIAEQPAELSRWESLMLYCHLRKNRRATLEVFDQAPEGKSDVLYHIKALAQDVKMREGSEIAMSCFKKALEINPLNVEARLSLATLLNRLERHEEALGLWNQLIELDPHWSEAWVGRARCFHRMGDQRRAIKALNAGIFCLENGSAFALMQNPESKLLSAYYKNRADCYLELGKEEDALKGYLDSLKQDPGFKDSVVSATEILIKQKKIKMAIAIGQSYLEKNPDDSDWVVAIMGLYSVDNNLMAVKKAYRELERIQGSNMDFQYKLAYAETLIRSNWLREALGFLERLLPEITNPLHRRQCYESLLGVAERSGDQRLFDTYQRQAAQEGLVRIR